MEPAVAERLLDINRTFYQQFADQFDATRQRLQPGVSRILESIPAEARVLDLGCGNGEFWRGLVKHGFRGEFVGLDFSEGLLSAARQETVSGARASFFQRDLSTGDWDAGIEGRFDVIVAFAVFHHLPPVFYPGILRKVRGLLGDHKGRPNEEHPNEGRLDKGRPNEDRPNEGRLDKDRPSEGRLDKDRPSEGRPNEGHSPARFFLSNWQFLNSERWRARIQSWDQVDLREADVDSGDYLLDWRRGGVGYRYVHHFSEDELDSLAHAAGFTISGQFHSDGKEGNLALYQTWEIETP